MMKNQKGKSFCRRSAAVLSENSAGSTDGRDKTACSLFAAVPDQTQGMG